MKKQYTVFSAHPQTAQADVELNGQTVQATINTFDVQLVPVDGVSGTIKLSLSDPAEIQEASAKFTDGATIELEF